MTYRQWEIPFEALSDAQRQGVEYWRSLSGADGAPPAVDAFSLRGFAPEVLPLTHIVDVLNGGEEFRYRFWGSGFRDYFGYDGTGFEFKDLRPPQIIKPVRQANRRVVRERRAIAMMSEFERGPKHDVLGFQRIARMPLLGADGAVARIVSIVEFMFDYRESQRIIEENRGEPF